MGDTGRARDNGGIRPLFALGLFLVVAVGALSACDPPGPRTQAAFQADVASDRGRLFAGRLDYRSQLSTGVDEPRTFRITLTGLSAEAASRSTLDETLTETRSFPVGGVEGAALTATDPDVRVTLLTDVEARQVIARPGDAVEWWWSVSSNEPGDYELLLSITTYQGDSDRALATLTPPITVRLHVDETWDHSLDAMLSTIVTWGGVAIALTALLAFRAPITTFVQTRKSTRQERHRDHYRDGYR
ncbi:hypothetical protein PV396_06005 [Streptomyces sp. ME02-8801-2C]|uniref:hypothetical protein n=1 Tax=Streptomyces sp. ME02-8801-2C TaxID=3028680 RepID=UPI0029AEAAA8|nr:hypothetical protein [Streptomyces sp. ME02-8801-2C]MDX3451509.1 hypothetical protein [Streptomyces sp. ME02-8801-2C]